MWGGPGCEGWAAVPEDQAGAKGEVGMPHRPVLQPARVALEPAMLSQAPSLPPRWALEGVCGCDLEIPCSSLRVRLPCLLPHSWAPVANSEFPFLLLCCSLSLISTSSFSHSAPLFS